MKTLVFAASALALMAGVATADPVKLSSSEMQGVAGGFLPSLLPSNNVNVGVGVAIPITNVVDVNIANAIAALSKDVTAGAGSLTGAGNVTGVSLFSPVIGTPN
jgi:hypothetical protein